MSRLWRDQLEVFFAPERIKLVRSSRGFKPIKSVAVTERISNIQGDQPTWVEPLNQLDKMLDAAGAGITVTLSNHFVRYVTLPPQSEISTPEEVFAYADFRMREIFGARVDQWVLSISMWNPVYGAIAAAISQTLLAKLQEVAVRHRIKLNYIDPYFSAVMDRWSKSLNPQKSYVALIEAGRVCVGLLEKGVWKSIRNQRILHNVAEELWTVLDQEAVLSGHKESVEYVYLFAPEHPSLTLPQESGWYFVPLQSEMIPVPAHYPALVVEEEAENKCIA